MKALFAVLASALLALGAFNASADEAVRKTVAALHQDKAKLAGKLVQVKGKVVKVNNGIMGRNFVHVQDGTGEKATGNLVVTSAQTAAVGDQVTVTGRVVVDRDFGSGYMYPLLVEEATIAPQK
jgi:hypothetical protein